MQLGRRYDNVKTFEYSKSTLSLFLRLSKALIKRNLDKDEFEVEKDGYYGR
jgi:hypothetical protein